MSTPAQVITVSVLDEKGASLQVVKIEAVSATTITLSPGPGGIHRTNLDNLTDGGFKIRLSFSDRPMFELPFIVKKTTSEWLVKHNGTRPMCCSLSREKVGASGKWTELRFNVILRLPRKHEEIIFVAGWDYEGHGTDFIQYCYTLRDDLYFGNTYCGGRKKSIKKRINDGTLVTIFDFKTGIKRYALKGLSGWVNAGEKLQGVTPTWLEKYNLPFNVEKRHKDDSISISHVYNYIAYLGNISANSVIGLHFLSHAWQGGPILVNTFQEEMYEDGSNELRDPGDKDPRLKDFSARNIGNYDKFISAFSSDAVVKIWGCFDTEVFRCYLKAASSANDETTPIKVNLTRDGVLVQQITTTKKEIIYYFKNSVLNVTYMHQFANALKGGVNVYGAPPGIGASFKSVSTPTGKRQYIHVNEVYYSRYLKFYANSLKCEFDESYHMRYH